MLNTQKLGNAIFCSCVCVVSKMRISLSKKRTVTPHTFFLGREDLPGHQEHRFCRKCAICALRLLDVVLASVLKPAPAACPAEPSRHVVSNCALASSSAAAWPSGAQVGGLAEDAEQRPEKAHVCRAGRAVRLCGPSPAHRRRFHDFTHILSLLAGALLGLRFTVYVLVVVIYFATAVIAGVGAAGEVDAWWISLDAVGATALQMGYLAGAPYVRCSALSAVACLVLRRTYTTPRTSAARRACSPSDLHRCGQPPCRPRRQSSLGGPCRLG
jgi:hypothetical protein